MKRNNTLTPEQASIVKEYIDCYGLAPEQITFEGDDTRPIFDHNAISVLTLRVTDIADISPMARQVLDDTVTVLGKVTLPDGRSRGCIGSCTLGEVLPNGSKVSNDQVALGVATSRCFRQGIRNVGVDLHTSHRHFKVTGEVLSSHTNRDPRAANYAEIHMLATEIGLIVDGDKSGYRDYLSDNYAGRITAKDLDDIELQRLLTSFRSLARVTRERRAA